MCSRASTAGTNTIGIPTSPKVIRPFQTAIGFPSADMLFFFLLRPHTLDEETASDVPAGTTLSDGHTPRHASCSVCRAASGG